MNLHSAFCVQLVMTLAHCLWQATAIALLAALAAMFLRKSKPGLRYGVFVLALVAMAACPGLTFWMLGGSGEDLSPEMMPTREMAAGVVETTGTARTLKYMPPLFLDAVIPPREPDIAPTKGPGVAIIGKLTPFGMVKKLSVSIGQHRDNTSVSQGQHRYGPFTASVMRRRVSWDRWRLPKRLSGERSTEGKEVGKAGGAERRHPFRSPIRLGDCFARLCVRLDLKEVFRI